MLAGPAENWLKPLTFRKSSGCAAMFTRRLRRAHAEQVRAARWSEGGRMRICQFSAWRGAILALALVGVTANTATAQWLSVPVPGTPRTPDGKPNLTVAAPRTADGKPDHSGIWKVESNRFNNNLLPDGVEAPMLPWAAEVYKQRVATFGHDRPMTQCMPHGVPDAMTVTEPALQDHSDAGRDSAPVRGIPQSTARFTPTGASCPSILTRIGTATRSAGGRARRSSSRPPASKRVAGWTTTAIHIPRRCARRNASAGSISAAWSSP